MRAFTAPDPATRRHCACHCGHRARAGHRCRRARALRPGAMMQSQQSMTACRASRGRRRCWWRIWRGGGTSHRSKRWTTSAWQGPCAHVVYGWHALQAAGLAQRRLHGAAAGHAPVGIPCVAVMGRAMQAAINRRIGAGMAVAVLAATLRRRCKRAAGTGPCRLAARHAPRHCNSDHRTPKHAPGPQDAP